MPLSQLPLINNSGVNSYPFRSYTTRKIAHWGLFIYVFACFFPYPGVEVGRSSGIQAAHLLGIFYLPFMVNLLIRRFDFLIIYLTLAIPSFIAIFVGTNDTSNLNAAIFQAYGLLTIIITGTLVTYCGIRPVINAAVFAIVIHSTIGVWQQISYLNESFPLAWIYTNPSFSLMDPESIRVLYGVYTKRSFGIFPEPSSMFSSLAPFLIFLIYGKKYYPLLDRKIYIGIIAGLILFYFSKSGGILYFLLACAPFAWASFKEQIKKKNSFKFIYLFSIALVLALIFWEFWEIFQNRAQSEIVQEDGSWAQRTTSITFALNMPFEGSIFNLLFGYGLGDVSILAGEATGRPSVHSWLAQNFMGSGLLGTFALFFTFLKIVKNINACNNKNFGFVCFFMWFVCVSFITGYFQLLAIWVFLGILLTWKNIKWG